MASVSELLSECGFCARRWSRKMEVTVGGGVEGCHVGVMSRSARPCTRRVSTDWRCVLVRLEWTILICRSLCPRLHIALLHTDSEPRVTLLNRFLQRSINGNMTSISATLAEPKKKGCFFAFYLNRTGDLFIENLVLVKRSSH